MDTIADVQKSSLVIKNTLKSGYDTILSNEALCFIEKYSKLH